MSMCFAALPCEWLDTNWLSISPSHLSDPSSPLAAGRTAPLKATNGSCSICTKPLLPALKEPPCLQWRLSPFTDFLSLSALSPLLLSIPPSLFSYSLSIIPLIFILSSLRHTYFLFPLFLSSLFSFCITSTLSLSSHVLLSLSVQHLCRLEFSGQRKKVFFLFCVCVLNWEGGETTPNTWPTFHREMWTLRNWSPPAFPQLFIFFFFIATPGMLNVDWWMFPNSASLTLSATTTSRCIYFTSSPLRCLFFNSAVVPILGERIYFTPLQKKKKSQGNSLFEN